MSPLCIPITGHATPVPCPQETGNQYVMTLLDHATDSAYADQGTQWFVIPHTRGSVVPHTTYRIQGVRHTGYHIPGVRHTTYRIPYTGGPSYPIPWPGLPDTPYQIPRPAIPDTT